MAAYCDVSAKRVMATPLKVPLIVLLYMLSSSEAGFPRLHFSGQFLADTATLNNNPVNFNINDFNINRDPPCYPNYTFPHCNWNPKGGGDFRFVNCSVTKVCYNAGKCTTHDPIVGKRITGSDDTVAAKMSDLDPYFQMYTAQLWGLVIGVEGAFHGKFKTRTVQDVWQRCKEEECPGDPGSSGYWSSVLETVTWADPGCTCETGQSDTFIHQLKCPRGEPAETLYVKFTVDMMNEDPRTPNFAHGRVIGTISSVDPDNHKAGIPEFTRMLWGQGVISALEGNAILPEQLDYYHAPFYMEREIGKKLVVDLSNSLPTQLDGKLVDRGNLFLLLIYNSSSLQMEGGMIKNCDDVLNNPGINVGHIRYTAEGWLWRDAGMVILDIGTSTNEDNGSHQGSFKAVFDKERWIEPTDSAQVMVVKEDPPPCQQCQKQCLPVLVEHPDGLYVGAAEDRVFRMPESSAVADDDGHDEYVSWSLKIFATKFGAPAKGIELIVQPSKDPKLHKDISKPENAITYNQAYTDEGGMAVIQFQTKRVGLKCTNPCPELANRRANGVDGQLYVYDVRRKDGKNSFPPNLQTTTHLYCELDKLDGCTWVDDVYPIFQLYGNLYPVMKPLFNLASYKEVSRDVTRKHLLHSLQLPLEDPNHMPVTRDLSPAKRDMIIKWLNDTKYKTSEQTTRVAELKENLQLALRLEWTTVPLYLSAYYSIKDGFNTKVAKLLKSIVVEEMFHMALAANILNAIGGAPVLNDPALVPTYPGPLPGGCRPDITVQLSRCSLDQIHDVFMAVETPECAGPIIDELKTMDATFMSAGCDDLLAAVTKKCRDKVEHYRPDTIGAIYIHKILCLMVELYNSGVLRFNGDPTRQYPEPFPVTDICSAVMAIRQIIGQGEGGDPCSPTYTSPEGAVELSHYYKFAEIVHNKGLVKVSGPPKYFYTDREGGDSQEDRGSDDCEKDGHDLFTPCDGQVCCKDKYEFAGARIPFFENAVWPTLPNPSSARYPPGSRARKMSDRFNEKYSGLMRCLHDVFNGNPAKMGQCFGLMSSLTVDAKKMVQTPVDPDGDPNVGPNVAPTFEWYPPING
ncbi:Hypp8707 [Branchiostoma lanceolatum]|uniref:Hypp8707 protein n=1 Tax=Branchiostoma lanceolatum TaxID=7740 RepID=A0A8J9ZAT9_BRALA|nr:Hypp8707 [Branchiostoma lanceolatum]